MRYSMKEHRRFNRADLHTKGFFHFDEMEIDFKIKNISLNGVLVETENIEKLPINSEVSLFILLSSSDIQIRTSAILLHIEGKKLGFQFEEIDVESMIHLRRLVELNSLTPDEIAKELPFLKKK
jgi:hypothetical protein